MNQQGKFAANLEKLAIEALADGLAREAIITELVQLADMLRAGNRAEEQST
jgi:hypothetical protein